MDPYVDANCRNCDTPLAGKFCHACGQKRFDPSERTLKHFIIQFFGSAFFLENNFGKNVLSLVARPGRQPVDVIEGRQRRWMPPFSLFLLINLFYFWSTPLTDMNLSLHEQVAQFQHSFIAKKMVTNRLEKRQVTFEEYERQYNTKSSGYSNSLIILHVPMFAVMLMLLYGRAKRFFADYFVISLYYLAFMLLMAMIVVGIVDGLAALFPSTARVIVGMFSWLMLLCMLSYTFIYLNNVFRQKWYVTGVKTALFIFFVFAVHMVYRTILFFVIFWAT